MSIVEDTGELHHLAEQLHLVKHDPRQPGPLDFVLASAALAGTFVVGLCALILTLAPDEYPVERGRVVLTMAAAGFCTAPVMAALFGIVRVTRRRHIAVMEKLDRIACDRRPPVGANGRPLSPSEYFKVYSDAMKDLGDITPEE